ncbi:1143_t:CDS:2 [Funneliformis caledonium]|uniref:1143_t:CDS:1 n=1 Tax=Funneliformis caledonium TaxID=1117310 RepID=A0A9N9B6H9_9GLOM|nr:1143_t:CDS:2 [Funneliformis caledonium]
MTTRKSQQGRLLRSQVAEEKAAAVVGGADAEEKDTGQFLQNIDWSTNNMHQRILYWIGLYQMEGKQRSSKTSRIMDNYYSDFICSYCKGVRIFCKMIKIM